MSWTIGTVTLPNSPARVTHPLAAIVNKFKITGGTTLIQGVGIDAETMTWNLVLHNSGYTLDQLFTTYLSPLGSYLNTAVAVSCPRSFHNGTWLLTNLDPEESNDAPDRVNVTIKFTKGSAIQIL